MIKKLTERLIKEKESQTRYHFEQTDGVAGFCPDCEGIVCFVPSIQEYMCINPECQFEADINCERI